jgi:hypothetical protein
MAELLTEKTLGGKYKHAFYYAAAKTFERGAPQAKLFITTPTAILASTVVSLSTEEALLETIAFVATYATVSQFYVDIMAYSLSCFNKKLNTIADSTAGSIITSGVSFFCLEESATTAATTAGIEYGMVLSEDANKEIQGLNEQLSRFLIGCRNVIEDVGNSQLLLRDIRDKIITNAERHERLKAEHERLKAEAFSPR